MRFSTTVSFDFGADFLTADFFAFGATFLVVDFFVFGAVFLAETLLAVFFEDFFFEAGFVFFLAGFFAAFSSLAVNCLTRFSAAFTSF